MNMRAPHGHLTHTYYHGRKEELGARIPTISGYKMLGFLADSGNGRNTTCRGKSECCECLTVF